MTSSTLSSTHTVEQWFSTFLTSHNVHNVHIFTLVTQSYCMRCKMFWNLHQALTPISYSNFSHQIRHASFFYNPTNILFSSVFRDGSGEQQHLFSVLSKVVKRSCKMHFKQIKIDSVILDPAYISN